MPRTGRPTDDPKSIPYKVRLSNGDIEKLDYCQKMLGLTKAEIIRQGIEEVYQKVHKEK